MRETIARTDRGRDGRGRLDGGTDEEGWTGGRSGTDKPIDGMAWGKRDHSNPSDKSKTFRRDKKMKRCAASQMGLRNDGAAKRT